MNQGKSIQHKNISIYSMSHESEVLKMINTYADWGQKKVILEIVLDR